MWGESSQECCGTDCHCSALITDKFQINSGNNATKRRREEAASNNFKLKMNPHSLNFNSPSPVQTSKRRILGEIQNSPSQLNIKKSPLLHNLESPLSLRLLNSPKLNRSFVKRTTTKISQIFEERTKFKMSSNKENELIESETFMKLEVNEEETTDSAFSELTQSPISNLLQRSKTVKNWTLAKMTPDTPPTTTSKRELPIFGIDDYAAMDSDLDDLQDLDAEFDSCGNFDQCTNYEIISTESPDIISRGRTASSIKISSKNFVFGAPIAETEQSTSFNSKINPTAKQLNFEDDSFQFASPEHLRKQGSVKKSLKFFGETPTKVRHDSGMSSVTMSPVNSTKLQLFPSESGTSIESGFVSESTSGFISEADEAFFQLEDTSSSPKITNFNELLSGEIKQNPEPEFSLKRPTLMRSLSCNPDANRARVSLFSRTDSEAKRSCKRPEPLRESELSSKRRRANEGLRAQGRPVLQRAYSENAASIMSALARSASNPDLIGDFSVPFLLPLTSGNHSDLKSISCETLAALLQGGYKDTVDEFQVIDCRYPYEFNGGHINGAHNLYTPEQILSLINEKSEPTNNEGRKIIVFHCEFSLERGPNLSRFLRSSDRAKNKENYPSLHYPEIYLLHDGYSAFYRKYPNLCTPIGYTTMLDPNHKAQLSTFRRLYPTSGRRSFMI